MESFRHVERGVNAGRICNDRRVIEAIALEEWTGYRCLGLDCPVLVQLGNFNLYYREWRQVSDVTVAFWGHFAGNFNDAGYLVRNGGVGTLVLGVQKDIQVQCKLIELRLASTYCDTRLRRSSNCQEGEKYGVQGDLPHGRCRCRYWFDLVC